MRRLRNDKESGDATGLDAESGAKASAHGCCGHTSSLEHAKLYQPVVAQTTEKLRSDAPVPPHFSDQQASKILCDFTSMKSVIAEGFGVVRESLDMQTRQHAKATYRERTARRDAGVASPFLGMENSDTSQIALSVRYGTSRSTKAETSTSVRQSRKKCETTRS